MLTAILFSFAEALLMALAVMTLLWIVTEKLKDSSLVDAAWSLCILVLALHFAAQPTGWIIRDTLFSLIVFTWAFRLSVFIFTRNHGKGEDPRYTELKKNWGEKRKLKMLQFFWAQGAAAALFTLPFILMSLNAANTLQPLEILAAILVVCAVLGEASADLSLARFKANSANKGKTCREGLWNYSRHPNYFFEWLVWCGFALMASAAPWGWLAWLCPAAMLHFLLNVTGIPKTEEQSLKSRGEDYRDYQRSTSKFVPWFKKT